MIISTDTQIPYLRSLVYATYRDKITDLVPYMPNVTSIIPKSHRQEQGIIHTVNEWYGGGDIPMAARAIISQDMLSWLEYNTWNESENSLEWRIETKAFTEAVSCQGKNYFRDNNGTTVIESRGELAINPKKIHGAPSFLAGQIARVVEDFLGSKIQPNLLQMGEGVRKYLDRQVKVEQK
jgi:hypothetical protein